MADRITSSNRLCDRRVGTVSNVILYYTQLLREDKRVSRYTNNLPC